MVCLLVWVLFWVLVCLGCFGLLSCYCGFLVLYNFFNCCFDRGFKFCVYWFCFGIELVNNIFNMSGYFKEFSVWILYINDFVSVIFYLCMVNWEWVGKFNKLLLIFCLSILILDDIFRYKFFWLFSSFNFFLVGKF